MKKFIHAAAIIGVVFAMISPAKADPASQRDVVGLLTGAPDRYVPHPVGVPVDLHYVFGPYVVPAGQDSNRITVDIPIQTGYVIAIAPDLVDATTGRIPTQQEAHIHHAHWFRVTNDPNQDYYTNVGGQGLSWVFGTGEEKSQGRLEDRGRLESQNHDADPANDFTYGIFNDGSTPNAMIYMIHNKQVSTGYYLVVLDVTFIPGTREEIKAATGRDVHTLYEQLWGQTKDVTDTSTGIGARWTVSHDGMGIAMGSHVHPGGKAVVVSNIGPNITETLSWGPGPTEQVNVTHPMCYSASLNSAHKVVQTAIDPDADGYPGVAILDSYKYDRDMAVWPYSENYQMGTTKFGWRAPLHKGDMLEQKAAYALTPSSSSGVFDIGSRDVLFHNWYQAMSYTGIYYDREQSPGAAPTTCDMASFAPHLLGQDTFGDQGLSSSWLDGAGAIKSTLTDGVSEVASMYNHFLPGSATDHERIVQGMVNHIWQVKEPLCAQTNLPALKGIYPACGPSTLSTTQGPEVTQIHTAGFQFVPGDLNLATGTPVIPLVRQGTTITLVNEDTIANVRHTYTSCEWPCVGTYVSNFPLSSGGPGSFDSGKLGNIDPIDGGLFNDGSDLAYFLGGGQSDTVPVYKMFIDPAKFAPGKYSYFCRIHPFMRGGFEVIAA